MSRSVKWMTISLSVHAGILGAFVYLFAKPAREPVLLVDFSLQTFVQPQEKQTPPKQRLLPEKKTAEKEIVSDTVVAETVPVDTVQAEIMEAAPIPRTIEFAAEPVAIKPDQHDEEKKYIAIQYGVIRDKVYRNLSYPVAAQEAELQGSVNLRFKINRDGSVDSIRVIESSGYAMLDENAVKAVRKSAPFPLAPAKLEIKLPIVYRLE
jgi:TonB family protein